MKIAIIGAGNMGGAIARGIAKHFTLGSADMTLAVSNPSEAPLVRLKEEFPLIQVSKSNLDVVGDADLVILAVKPWIVKAELQNIAQAINPDKTAILSIAGGIGLEDLINMYPRNCKLPALFHAIPNTAISVGKGITFVQSSTKAGSLTEIMGLVNQVFSAFGEVVFVNDSKLMNAGTALCSCGIAYVYKYIQACVSAGVQMGFYPQDALKYVIATVEGAAQLLKENGTLPQQEIDRVTTPGGMTIRGINELDHAGFSSAVIRANLKPIEK